MLPMAIHNPASTPLLNTPKTLSQLSPKIKLEKKHQNSFSADSSLTNTHHQAPEMSRFGILKFLSKGSSD